MLPIISRLPDIGNPAALHNCQLYNCLAYVKLSPKVKCTQGKQRSLTHERVARKQTAPNASLLHNLTSALLQPLPKAYIEQVRDIARGACACSPIDPAAQQEVDSFLPAYQPSTGSQAGAVERCQGAGEQASAL